MPEVVNGDPGRLRQVLLNLVNNAVKFTTEGEISIRIVVKSEDSRGVSLLFEVADTGIGVSKIAQSRLFKSYSQVDASTSRKFGGTGLGLAISKRLVILMGGTIGIESEEGVGSTFRFSVVLSRAEKTEEHVGLSLARLDDVRVLLIDDDARSGRILMAQLEDWGCAASLVVSEEEALRHLSQGVAAGQRCSLILIDGGVANLEIERFCESLSSLGAEQKVELIFMPEVPKHGDAKRMKLLGVEGYLPKPIKRSRLHQVMSLVLGRGPSLPGSRDPVTRFSVAEIAQSKRILLAEDNRVNQKVAVRTLEKWGLTCDVVENGRDAVNAVMKGTYDIVLMDCKMPELDGYDATREIRRLETGGRHTRIIALTASALKEDRELCIEAGMDAYLSKPFRSEELAAILTDSSDD